MKQGIQLRLGQQLTMTPQLQQAIRLLQLSTIDLQREIQDALESNLMLETVDEEESKRDESSDSNDASELAADGTHSSVAEAGTSVDAEIPSDSSALPDDLPVDSEWSDTYESAPGDNYAGPTAPSGSGVDNQFDLFSQQSRPQTLHDHLQWQLNLSHFSERDQIIAEALLDGIDADGYLRLSLEDLLGTLELEDLELDELEMVLHRIQALDPPGVGARDPRECLLLQLRQLPVDTPYRQGAMTVCDLLFESLARNDLDELRRRTKLPSAELGRCLELVRSLQPRPGSLISEVRPDYVIPDVLVRKRAGTWQVELNPETQPKLRVNDDYAKLIRRADDGAENACLKSHLQEARWFIKSLLSRNDTVLRVAAKIVELQRDFFDYGEEAMRPLILRDVADSLDLHESTVSRVTTQKYMHTPRGTLEFKYFFSSHVGTATGGECSSTAIRAFIRKLVAAEATSKPLSDSKIAGILSEQGINVARRTVAKYREAMGIPPSNERKRL
jgi:RNA polymerase sigma-54 factor